MGDAQLFPIDAIVGMRAAKLGAHPVAELANRNSWSLGPKLKQRRRRHVADEVKSFTNQGERGSTGEEFCFRKRMNGSVREGNVVGEGEFLVTVFQGWRQGNDLAV